jgi:hypothetical protein
VRTNCFAALGLCAVLASTCAPAHIPAIHRPAVSDKPYTTYFLLPGSSSDTPAVDQQLASDVKLALADRGWLEVAPKDARAVFVMHVATSSRRSLESFYADWGGWQWQSPDAASQAPTSYAPGTVVIDGFDASTHQLLWRGTAPHFVRELASARPVILEHRAEQLTRAVPDSSHTAGAYEDTPGTPGGAPIAFAQGPVAIVRIDGVPRYQPVNGTEFQRIINTRSFIVKDAAGLHYLKLPTGWMEADTWLGPWAAAGTVPEGIRAAFERTRQTTHVDEPAIARAPGDGSTPGEGDGPPAVLVTSEQASVVVTNGEVVFAPVDGTRLMRAVNASAPLFREPTDAQLYLRLADGWFRSWALEAPWERVAASSLPADFSRVPTELLAPTTLPAARR